MTFLRLPLDGGPPLLEVHVPIPVDPKGQTASHWALAPTASASPRLVARLGDMIIGKNLLLDSRGFVLVRDAAGASELRLEQVDGVWWAVWIDPGMGLRYASLPESA